MGQPSEGGPLVHISAMVEQPPNGIEQVGAALSGGLEASCKRRGKVYCSWPTTAILSDNKLQLMSQTNLGE